MDPHNATKRWSFSKRAIADQALAYRAGENMARLRAGYQGDQARLQSRLIFFSLNDQKEVDMRSSVVSRITRLFLGVMGSVVLVLGLQTAQAQDVVDEVPGAGEEENAGWTEVLEVHGFGSWSAGYTDKNNQYHNLASPTGNWDRVTSALVVTAQPVQQLSIHTSSEFLVEGEELEIEIDFAFAEWAFSDQFKLKLGQVKHPFGFYSEIFDVGTLRPFVTLPLNFYGPSGLIAEFYRGVGVSGSVFAESGWGLSYDLYFGNLDIPEYHPWGSEEAEAGEGGEEEGEEETINTIGAKLTFDTPLEGFRFGVAGLTGEVVEEDARRVVLGVHAELVRDNVSIRGEYGRLMEFADGEVEEEMDSFYVELTYKPVEWLQLAAQYTWSNFEEEEEEDPTEPEPDPSLFKHQEITAGINYWFSPNLILKISYHYVIGNRFVHPPEEELEELLETGGELDDQTHVLFIGTAFSF